jgi:hypothetical protein
MKQLIAEPLARLPAPTLHRLARHACPPMQELPMTAKTTPRAQTTQDGSIPGQTAVNEITRQQLAAVADGASALLRASEVITQVQQQAVQRAALTQQQTAEKLRSMNHPGELLIIQSGLMMTGMQEAAQYLQELTAASLRLQAEMLGRAGQQQGASSNVAGAAMSPVMSPMMQAWQSMFSAPLNSVAQTATTTH